MAGLQRWIDSHLKGYKQRNECSEDAYNVVVQLAATCKDFGSPICAYPGPDDEMPEPDITLSWQTPKLLTVMVQQDGSVDVYWYLDPVIPKAKSWLLPKEENHRLSQLAGAIMHDEDIGPWRKWQQDHPIPSS